MLPLWATKKKKETVDDIIVSLPDPRVAPINDSTSKDANNLRIRHTEYGHHIALHGEHLIHVPKELDGKSSIAG